MNLPDEKRDQVAEVLVRARFRGLGGMTEAEACRYLADALAPLLAGWLAEEGARVREQMREEIARAAHGLPANNLARAALALADEENVALLDRLEAAEAKVARVEAVADECDRRTAREPDRVLTFWVRRLRAALDADAAETTGGGA